MALNHAGDRANTGHQAISTRHPFRAGFLIAHVLKSGRVSRQVGELEPDVRLISSKES